MNTSSRRILCLSLPDLRLHTALLAHPELEGKPLVIGGAPSEPRPVVACSAEAANAGVQPGMRLKEAQSCCPEAIFLSEMPAEVGHAMAQIGARLAEVSPLVESADDGVFWIDLAGSQRMWPDERALVERVMALVAQRGSLTTRIGIAGTKYAALVAALEGDVHIVAPGEDARFLHGLPIDRLPAPEPMLAALCALGVETLGAFAALPANAVVMRFGKEARRLHLLARGCDESPVVAPTPMPPLETRIVYEGGETIHDRLLWMLERRLGRLYRQMDRAGLAARALRLTLFLENGGVVQDTLPLVDPLLRLPQLRQLLRWHMETLTLPAPVVESVLALTGLTPLHGQQLDLFARQAEGDLRRLFGELIARWGAAVRQPKLVRSRRVEQSFAWTEPELSRAPDRTPPTELRPRPLLRLLPEPRQVVVTIAHGRPTALTLGRKRERILAAGGPWRLCEGWWDNPMERDEYQMCTQSAVYYVVHDRRTDVWSLLGAFD